MKKILSVLLITMSLMASSTHTAKVVETLNSGGYSYIKVQEGSKLYWIAMTQRPVKVGEGISYNEQGWMQNFHSKTLNRTFDKILFASDATVSTHQETLTHQPDVMNSKYKLKETLTIAQLFANRDRYVGKKVKVRGVVTKTSAQIMKKNWVHLQDGSRFQGQDDLVFTTQSKMPEVGSVVIAEGVLVKDKDFGYGYFYPVIIETAMFHKQ